MSGVLDSHLTSQSDQIISIGEAAELACLLEVSAPKVGNVHRGADFDDTTFYDFLISATAIRNVFDRAPSLTLGELVLGAISRTQQFVGTNTNLGIVLLLAPLAKCPATHPQASLEQVLQDSDATDCQKVFQAISLAQPGGMGNAPEADVNDESYVNDSLTLLDAMRMAKERDAIARQYDNGFEEVFNLVFPVVRDSIGQLESISEAIVYSQLKILSQIPDTLIARKCGKDLAAQCTARALNIVEQTKVGTREYYSAVEDLDFWMRSDGHRRNPGTTADFVSAGLFLCIRQGILSVDKIKKSLVGARSLDSK